MSALSHVWPHRSPLQTTVCRAYTAVQRRLRRCAVSPRIYSWRRAWGHTHSTTTRWLAHQPRLLQLSLLTPEPPRQLQLEREPTHHHRSSSSSSLRETLPCRLTTMQAWPGQGLEQRQRRKIQVHQKASLLSRKRLHLVRLSTASPLTTRKQAHTWGMLRRPCQP